MRNGSGNSTGDAQSPENRPLLQVSFQDGGYEVILKPFLMLRLVIKE